MSTASWWRRVVSAVEPTFTPATRHGTAPSRPLRPGEAASLARVDKARRAFDAQVSRHAEAWPDEQGAPIL